MKALSALAGLALLGACAEIQPNTQATVTAPINGSFSVFGEAATPAAPAPVTVIQVCNPPPELLAPVAPLPALPEQIDLSGHDLLMHMALDAKLYADLHRRRDDLIDWIKSNCHTGEIPLIAK